MHRDVCPRLVRIACGIYGNFTGNWRFHFVLFTNRSYIDDKILHSYHHRRWNEGRKRLPGGFAPLCGQPETEGSASAFSWEAIRHWPPFMPFPPLCKTHPAASSLRKKDNPPCPHGVRRTKQAALSGAKYRPCPPVRHDRAEDRLSAACGRGIRTAAASRFPHCIL